MGQEGAAAMAVAHEELKKEAQTEQRQTTPREPEPEVAGPHPPNMGTMRKDKTHISNEMLLAAGGTVAGAAFLGGAFGGAFGAVAAAVAGLGVAIFNAKSKLKEGARRS